MADGTAGAFRRRDTMLEGLELFRSVRAPRPYSSLILFLYACENEGLTFTELAALADMPLASASRLIKALAGARERGKPCVDPPVLGFDGSASDGRLKLVRLTDDGRAMRDALEGVIAQARPISD
jgi:hypothetical protein